MASTEKAKNKIKKSIENSNLGKSGPKSKRTKPVGSKKRKKGAHWKGSSEVKSGNVGTGPIFTKKMESDDSDVEIAEDLTDDPVVPKTKSLKVSLLKWKIVQKWSKIIQISLKIDLIGSKSVPGYQKWPFFKQYFNF